MQSYSFDDYQSAVSSLRDELHRLQDDLAKEEFDYGTKEAGDDYLEKTRKYYVDYKKATNPYSLRRENLTGAGLGSSGKEMKAAESDFGEYQSYLSRAYKERDDITKDLVKNLLDAQAKNETQRLEGIMEDAKTRLENYRREYYMAYRRERDKAEDERYERELMAKYGLQEGK